MKKFGSKKILTAILYSIALSCCLANTSSAGTGTGIGTTATAGSLSTTTSPRTTSPNGGYEIIRDKVVYSRWRSIISRLVKMPNGHEVDYDVSFTSFHFNSLSFAGNEFDEHVFYKRFIVLCMCTSSLFMFTISSLKTKVNTIHKKLKLTK